ncbi:MAG: amidohydrolase family protein [Acidobacteriia bacterium]|nr:amidohydrolase family protein [Terriglobia bacterium]
MRTLITVLIIELTATVIMAQQPPPPVIDMHLHALPANSQGPPPLALCVPFRDIPMRDAKDEWPRVFGAFLKNPQCPDPMWSPTSDEEVMTQTLEILKRRNIIGVASGPLELVRRWRAAAPDRVIPGLMFQLGPQQLSPDAIRDLHERGEIAVLGEVTNQYIGISPSDSAFEPYLALAEQRDIPVGIHIGPGPPGAPYLGTDRYRAALHSPLLLEEALLRHPKLRLYVMHAGWPMIDDLLALLWTHPQVYVDVGVISYALPRAEFDRFLQRIVEAGFSKRVMFGSDQMVWPAAIERAIEAIESAPFLTAAQRRDILYNNAARFLRFSDTEIAKHHGR